MYASRHAPLVRVFEIVYGPSKDDLMKCFRLGARLGSDSPQVIFKVNTKEHLRIPTKVISAQVRELELEKCSADVWLLKLFDVRSSLGFQEISGYYNTRKISGHLRCGW